MSVRKLVQFLYLDPELKRAAVRVIQGIDLQRTVLLCEIPQQLCSIPVRLHDFGRNRVIDESIATVLPHPGEHQIIF